MSLYVLVPNEPWVSEYQYVNTVLICSPLTPFDKLNSYFIRSLQTPWTDDFSVTMPSIDTRLRARSADATAITRRLGASAFSYVTCQSVTRLQDGCVCWPLPSLSFVKKRPPVAPSPGQSSATFSSCVVPSPLKKLPWTWLIKQERTPDGVFAFSVRDKGAAIGAVPLPKGGKGEGVRLKWGKVRASLTRGVLDRTEPVSGQRSCCFWVPWFLSEQSSVGK